MPRQRYVPRWRRGPQMDMPWPLRHPLRVSIVWSSDDGRHLYLARWELDHATGLWWQGIHYVIVQDQWFYDVWVPDSEAEWP